MNNQSGKSNRIDQLIFTLNKLYCSQNNIELEELPDYPIRMEDVLSLLEENSFLNDPTKEILLFKKCSHDELISVGRNLYNRYLHSDNTHDKITLALLLSRLFSFYLPDANTLISEDTITFSATRAIENSAYESILEQFSSWITDPAQAPESVKTAIGAAFSGRAFQLLDQEIQKRIRESKPELFAPFSLAGYTLRMSPWFALNSEVIRIPLSIELASCGGADIFPLALRKPEKIGGINVSLDLWDESAKEYTSPISIIARPIKEKGIRLTSVDMECSKLVTSMGDLFNLRNDDLSLLKAAVIASGIVPPSASESKEHSLENILQLFLKEFPQYKGFELITSVVQIPRGAGFGISSSLLAGMLIALMRLSGQAKQGEISGEVKKEAIIRGLFAEWLNGCSSRFQDYAGMWGGFKEIEGSFSEMSFDKDSAGELYPIYREMKLSIEQTRQMLDSMVLVNGGMSQATGSVFKMLSERLITKSNTGNDACQRASLRLDTIRQVLQTGSPQELAALENEDFTDRALISPLANNSYHEQVAEQLLLLFGDDIWGYNSIGNHAGSGGIFWIDPYARELFEKIFIDMATQVQKDLRGQIHFVCGPLLHKIQLNEVGVSYESMNHDSAQTLIDIWQCRESEREAIDHYDQIELIKDIFGFNEKIFTQLQEDYKQGKISVAKNAGFSTDSIIHSSQKRLNPLPLPWSVEYIELFQQGLEYLTDPLAYVILNGGENTRYCSNVIRGINPSIYVNGKYRSPIELKMANLKFMRENFQAKIFPVFLNGHFTEKNTRRVLKSNHCFGIDEGDIFHSAHEVIHRVIPSVEDLEHWFETIREKSPSYTEEKLARQHHDTMKKWIREKGAAKVYQASGRSKTNALVSQGDYFSFISIISDGVLGKLLKRGVRSIVISGNDNLLSTIDPAILAFHVLQKNKATSEIILRLFDSESRPTPVDRKIQLSKEFAFPNQQAVWSTSFSHPITSWIDIEAILNLLNLDEADLISASDGNRLCKQKCREAVQELSKKLPTYPVLKHINEDMGKGRNHSYPVVQFEKLLRDFIALLNPELLLVPKLMRHTQIKSDRDTHMLYLDHSLEILQSQISLKNTWQQKPKERAVWA